MSSSPGPGPPQVRKGRVASLGWTREQAALVRGQLTSFEQDWNAAGMEAYDRL